MISQSEKVLIGDVANKYPMHIKKIFRQPTTVFCQDLTDTDFVCGIGISNFKWQHSLFRFRFIYSAAPLNVLGTPWVRFTYAT